MQRNCTWCRETEAQVKLFFMKTLVLRDFVRTSFHTEGTDRLGLPNFFSGVKGRRDAPRSLQETCSTLGSRTDKLEEKIRELFHEQRSEKLNQVQRCVKVSAIS